jgi:ribonuclease D
VNTLRAQPRIALDLETNGFFRYPERVCLIQIATPAGRVFLIDPLALDDMTPLGGVLSDERVEVILHSGDHDIRSLDRDWGFRVNSLFDTSIAAAFTGMDRLGLATVLESSLGVSINKSKKLQRSDWTIRPLKPKFLDYAADDVHYLLELADTLKKRLSNLGRLEWVAEESGRIAAIRYERPDPETAVFRVKGSRHLNPRGLAILKSLVAYREIHTLRVGRPHFRVIPDAALVSLAANPDSGLKKVRGMGRFAHGRLASGLRDAIRTGQKADPVRRPVVRRPRTNMTKAQQADARRHLDRLKKWRTSQGKSLTLDPALIWPMQSLKAIAGSPQDMDKAMRSPEVRHWQRVKFETSLRQVLRQ